MEIQRMKCDLQTTSRCKVVSIVNPSSIAPNVFALKPTNDLHTRNGYNLTPPVLAGLKHVAQHHASSRPPIELRDASKVPPGTNAGSRMSHRNCHELSIYGKYDNYTWGLI